MRLPALLTAALLPAAAAGQELVSGLRDLSGARALAMGNAFRAMGTGNETLFLNPSAMSLYDRYQIEVSSLYETEYDHHDLAVSILDSTTNQDSDVAVAGGIAYTHFSSGTGDDFRIGSQVALALSVPLVPQAFLLGVSGKYFALSGRATCNSITVDAGLTIRLAPQLTIAVVGYNLIDVRCLEAPRMVAFAVNYGGDGPVHLEADWRLNFASHPEGARATYQVGAEWYAFNLVWIRSGYVRDEVADVFNPDTGKSEPSQYVTGGVGFVISGIGVDFAYRNQIGGRVARTFAFTVKLML